VIEDESARAGSSADMQGTMKTDAAWDGGQSMLAPSARSSGDALAA
jgi:hypothetical protein